MNAMTLTRRGFIKACGAAALVAPVAYASPMARRMRTRRTTPLS